MQSRAVMDEAEMVAQAYEAVSGEVDAHLPIVSGALPPGLAGVLYRNGPGRLQVGPDRYGHPFDGDGMVVRLEIGDGRVHYRNRYVRTREFREEERAGRMLYRGFGSNIPGGLSRNLLRIRFKNAANTNVIWHGRSLLALWEGGLPHRLDPRTLETVDRYDYAGRLRPAGGLLDRLLAPELPYAAHPTIDPDTGELWSFGTLLGAQPKLMLYRVSPGGVMAKPESVALDRLSFVHDYVLTRKWRIFFLTPVAFDIPKALLGVNTPVGSISQAEGAPTTVLMVPREGGPPVVVETDPCFVFHFVSGHEERAENDGAEEETGRVIVYGLRMDNFPGGSVDLSNPRALAGLEYPPPLLTRFVLDPIRRTVSEERLTERPAELPVIPEGRATHPHRFTWATAKDDDTPMPVYRAIVKFDLVTGQERVKNFGLALPSEPLMVPRPGATAEDDGWLLVIVYQAADHRSELHVLDAGNLDTVCVAELPHHVPPGFHGSFVHADDAG
jgi:all-trans-8'-apo-beta-carotenal 15,15'-oxygenase